eukprot:m.138222 g.138222  ORF g.138222 m.138222 type:complete len:963 (-) comp17020_c0_seq5:48-2936(-)
MERPRKRGAGSGDRRTKPKRKASADTSVKSETVKVCLRVRPLTGEERSAGKPVIRIDEPEEDDKEPKSITFAQPPKGTKAASSSSSSLTKFTFSHVYDKSATQLDVFAGTTSSLVKGFVAGKNALLFTYGITNSGKTYTMQGDESEGGLLSRSLDILFNSINDYRAKWFTFKPDQRGKIRVQSAEDARAARREYRESGGDVTLMDASDKIKPSKRRLSYDPTKLEVPDKDSRYAVFVSYVEIYNDSLYDLLDDTPMKEEGGWDASVKKNKDTKKLVEVDGRMQVQGVTEVEVHSTEQAFELLKRGQQARQVACTELNAVSSRSHSVFNIRLVRAPLDAKGNDVLRSKTYPPLVTQFSLVDLAGSERTSRTGSQGDRQREAGGINKSLMNLRQCIEILRSNQASGRKNIVPYRNSILTMLFKNYFAGDGQVVMVVCVSPGVADAEETAHVLKFSALTQAVKTAASQPAPPTPSGLTPGRGIASKLIKNARRQMGQIAEEDEDEPLDESFAPPRKSSVTLLTERHHGSQATASTEHSERRRLPDFDGQRALLKQKESKFRTMLFEREALWLAQTDQAETLATQLSVAEEAVASLKAELARVRQDSITEQQDLNTRVDEQDIMIRDLQDQLQEQQSHNTTLEGELRTVQRQYDTLLVDHEQLQDLVEEQRMEIEDKQSKAAELAELRETLSEELKQKENLALAELNRKEQEWASKMGLTEKQLGRLKSQAEQERKGKAALEERLDLVRELLTGGESEAVLRRGRSRRRASSLSPPRAVRQREQESEDESDDDMDMMEQHEESDLAAGAKSTNNPPDIDQARTIREHERAKKEKKRERKRRRSSLPNVLNHKPADHVQPDAIMTPVIDPRLKSHTTTTPQVGDLVTKGGKVKHNKYILNHQEDEGEHAIFKGEVERSVSKRGVSVRFTGLESLTTQPTLTPLTRGRKGRPNQNKGEGVILFDFVQA